MEVTLILWVENKIPSVCTRKCYTYPDTIGIRDVTEMVSITELNECCKHSSLCCCLYSSVFFIIVNAFKVMFSFHFWFTLSFYFEYSYVTFIMLHNSDFSLLCMICVITYIFILVGRV